MAGQCGEGGSSKRAVDELATIKSVMARVSQCVPLGPNEDEYPWLASDSIPQRESAAFDEGHHTSSQTGDLLEWLRRCFAIVKIDMTLVFDRNAFA
jgi:hypothetical protein